MVLQKNLLFSGTIKENLRWGNENATDEELVEACRLAQADEFICSFPEGYDTMIGFGYKDLSGGEKQRVAIARAIVKKPEIILADEPTGNLNFSIGEAVIKQLVEISKGKTLIAVTHDERLGKYFDCTVDMNKMTGGRRDV